MGEPESKIKTAPARRTGDSGFNDEKMEWMMGLLLRVGVLLAATVVIAGGAMYLADHHGQRVSYRHFVGHPISVRHPAEMTGPTSLAVLDVGILLLVAVPIARVGFAVVAFLVERDWLYTAVSVLILAVLVWGMLRNG
jgi:uncharacterized membrane protein